MISQVKRTNSYFENHPIIITCNPPAFGSTPESKIAMTVPLPSYSGYLAKKFRTPVSFFGSRETVGKSVSPVVTAVILEVGFNGSDRGVY